MSITALPTDPRFEPEELADLIERHGDEALATIVAALRGVPTRTAAADTPVDHATSARAGDAPTWRQVGVIEGFEHVWPDVHEHYGPMSVWEGRDELGVVRLAIGKPRERLTLYGSERGWVSVWEVINGQPREQRAVFLETDDFATSGERFALISGKNGSKKAGFEPQEEDLLPTVYKDMRVEVHRDRFNGPYAKNRLGVIATDDDIAAMLNHARAHLRLRS